MARIEQFQPIEGRVDRVRKVVLHEVRQLLAFRALPLARADAALDIHRRPLAQVLAGDFSEAAVENDAVPFGDFLALAAGLVLPAFRRRQAATGQRSR